MTRTILLAVLAIAVTQAPAGAQVLEIALPTNDLIYDSARQRIYASVPSRAGAGLGNTITAINPATGALGPSVFVGSEPGKLALSGDGRYLYVALNGAAAVRRVDAATLTPGLQFVMGSDPYFGPYYVEDMEVLPGAPGSVAISRRRAGVSPGHGGVAVYDDGVMRPVVTADHTGSNEIEVGSTGARLYGLNTESSEFGFRRMDVAPAGVTVLDVTPNLVSRFNTTIVMDAGRMHFSSGLTIDPETRQIIGTYSTPSASITLVRPAVDIGRVFFLTDDTLRTFDAATFVPLGATPIAGVSGNPLRLIRVGPVGLAFSTDDDEVFLLGVLPSAATPTMTLTLTGCSSICRAGDSFSVSATVSNPGARAVHVEVKAGVSMPSGATMNIWSGGSEHYETTLAPGMNATVELLRATLPGGLEAGDWWYEAALLSPDLGRTVARDAKTFRIAP